MPVGQEKFILLVHVSEWVVS